MKLRDFISETIEEIAFGVHKAKVNCSDLVAVSPGNMNGESVVKMSEIEFDVAVSVLEKEVKNKAGQAEVTGEVKVLGVSVSGGIGGDVSKASESENSSVSRVCFKVPVYLNAHMRNDESIASEKELIAKLEKTGD